MKYDVRRPLRLTKPATGERIYNALKEIPQKLKPMQVSFEEEIVSDIAGLKIFTIGISSQYYSQNVVMRTGENLEEVTINLKQEYFNNIGVGSFGYAGIKFLVSEDESEYISAVEKVRDCLEKILNE